MSTTETYEQFKVIPKARLDALWKEIADSLSAGKETISELEELIDGQQLQLNEQKAELAEVKAELAASQEMTDTINFLGFSISEGAYHLIVWGLIAVFAGLGIFAYALFIRSNAVTSRSQRELASLTNEFEEHKSQAREKQIKLKRELQTAINKLNEKR